MNFQRRDFLKLTGVLGAGALASPLVSMAGCGSSSIGNANKGFGLQLYTLRDEMPKDPKGVLTKVAGFGYRQIESYEGPMGMFWGMSNTEFKKFLDGNGMTLISSHCDFQKDFERKAAEAGAIGVSYLICPYLGPQPKLDDFKRYADLFNKCGEICKKNGLRFAYHNHDYSFVPLEGQLPQDVMMQNTDKSLVDFEMDMYWVVTAGQDPQAWLKKYPDRFKLCHVKDRRKNADTKDRNASVILGTGSIDYKKILKDAGDKGMKFYIVEQEAYEGTTPLDASKADAAYMSDLKLA